MAQPTASSKSNRIKPNGSSRPASTRQNTVRNSAGQSQRPARPAATDWRLSLVRAAADGRGSLALGGLLMLISAGLLVAFVSYLFTGPADQSAVDAPLADVLPGSSGGVMQKQTVKNWLGLFGAYLGHAFVFRWFGVGALGLPIIVGLAGFKLATGHEPLPLARLTTATLFFALWVSLLVGYFILITGTIGSGSVWCGGIGYELNVLLRGLLGWGSIAVIGFVLFAFLVFFYNITSFGWLYQPFVAWGERIIYREPSDNTTGNQTVVVPESGAAPVAPRANTIRVKGFPPDEPADAAPAATSIGTTLRLKTEPGPIPDDDDDDDDDSPANAGNGAGTPADGKGTTLTVKGLTLPNDDDEAEIVLPSPITQPVFDIPVGENNDLDLVAIHGPYDPTLDLPHYQYPTLDLMTDYPSKQKAQVTMDELEANKVKIEETLGHFGIGIKDISATIGPTVTLYEIIPADGVRISKIKNLEDDIALSLAALGIRIIAPMPGMGTIGIEVPNKNREMVSARSVIGSEKFTKSNYELPIVLGKTISNEIYIADLTKMPHLLMAGATGQGKSVGLNVLLTSLIYKKHPAQLKLVLVDPKKVELTLFNKIERHFLAKLPDSEEAIITDTKKVVNTLNSLCIEMDNRYNLLKEAGVRNIKEYNVKFVNRKLSPEKGHKYLPYIVLIIDELADLMMTAGKEVETPIARLAQLARAIGIHLVVATQRPSVNVITGLIKANFPARLSFKVTSKIDSRTILDTGGAEQLVGMGDMLLSSNSDLIRLQCPFVDTPEIEDICAFVGEQRGYDDAYFLPEFVGDETGPGDENEVDLAHRDAMFNDAARLVVMHQQGSTSHIQRRMKLGYNRSGRIMDQLEAANIVGPFEGSKAREVLIQDMQTLEEILKRLDGN